MIDLRTEDEQILLGLLLLRNEWYSQVSEVVASEDFDWAAHRLIYDAMGKLIRNAQQANPVTMQKLFWRDDRAFPGRNPRQYLVQLALSAGYAPLWMQPSVMTRALAVARPDPGASVLDILTQYRPLTVSFQ